MEVGCDNCKTLLHIAARKEYINIIKFLVERGLDVNAKDIYGFTPLHMVAYKNNADVNSKSYDGRTPLHMVILGENMEVVKCLEQRWQYNFALCGTRGELALNYYGFTPLDMAISENNMDEIKKSLGCK